MRCHVVPRGAAWCRVVPRGAAWCRGAAVRWRRGAVWCPVMPSWTVGTTNTNSHWRRAASGPVGRQACGLAAGPAVTGIEGAGLSVADDWS